MFAHMALSWFKRRRPWFINWSNNALATVSFPSGMVGRFLKPQFRAQHERPGFLTARNHVIRFPAISCALEIYGELQTVLIVSMSSRTAHRLLTASSCNAS